MANSTDTYANSSDPTSALPAGTRAPDFSLKTTPDQEVCLADFRGQPVILAFYPADWSPVCGDQMALYNEILPEFQRLGAELLGISVDGVWCHLAFAKDRKLRFPLLSDFEPKGAVARRYGAYRHRDGVSERALYVIDGEGIIRWSYVSPIGVNPGADGILRALEDMPAQKSTEFEESTKTEESTRVKEPVSWMTEGAVLTLPVSGRDHIRGPATAPVTLVEYGDYECPFCGRAHLVVQEIERLIGDRLRFAFRHFPLTQAHPHAQLAAEAAEAAGAQGEFWAMHDLLYEHQQALDESHLLTYATAIGLDVKRFAREMSERLYAPRVREDFLSGVRSGVNGTPSFFINGRRHDGGYDLETLLAALVAAAQSRHKV